MFNKIENLKQYLLGNLSEKETEIIDLAIISDDSLEEKLLIAEHNLIEDFLEGSLSTKQNELFFNNFLISPERESQVAQIAGLKKYAGFAKSKKINSEIKVNSHENFFQQLKKSIFLQPARAAFAFVFVGVLLGVILITILNNSGANDLSPLEAEFVEINKKDFAEIEQFQNISKLSLISGSTRGADNSNTLKKEGLTEKVLFRLALPERTLIGEIFTINFEQNEKTIFTQNQIRSFKKENGEEFRFLVPSTILKPGDYLIKAKSDKTPVIVYPFVVE